jgi:hypothetical protein
VSDKHFPKLTIKGGPHGANIMVELDGKAVDRCTRVEFVADVHDAIRATIHQYVEVDIDVESVKVDAGEKVWLAVRVPEVIGVLGEGLREIRLKTTITAEGSDLASALRAAAIKAEEPTGGSS